MIQKMTGLSVNGIKKIDKQAFVSEIVKQDYRTAAVFRHHGIAFCCGSHFPLELACTLKGEDTGKVLSELESAVKTIHVSGSLKFDEWDANFLTNYIIHIHHDYLRVALPSTLELVKDFAEGHIKKFVWLTELVNVFSELTSEILGHIRYEEEIIFPYIRQVMHAYAGKEAYAGLFVRTLGKPVEAVMKQEQHLIVTALTRIRDLTQEYTIPQGACTSHKVSLLSLQELDQDLMQYLYLENNILLPKAIQMEKELLMRK